MKNKKILIVDDSVENRMLLKMLLEDDYSIEEAESGEACLVKVKQNKPDLILLDVNMPGLNGYQVCAQLRQTPATENITIIFVSGLDSVEERLAGFEAGGDEYIIKPVDGLDLTNKVKNHLQKQKENESAQKDANNAMKMALEAMTVSSELGQIIQFVKRGQDFKSRREIGHAMLKITKEFQLNASLMIISDDKPIFVGCDSDSTEAKFLIKAAESKERMFSLGIRFVLQDPNIVILIKQMPIQDENKTGRLKDHLAVLMDIANGYLVNVNAELMIKNQREVFLKKIITIAETQIEKTSFKIKEYGDESTKLVQNLVGNLESMLFSLGLEEDQEKKLMKLADSTSLEIENLSQSSLKLDKELDIILESLLGFYASIKSDEK